MNTKGPKKKDIRGEYEVVIIGGGVSGCMLAHFLSKKGMNDVLLLEKNYLSSGSTGRCGGGIRQQWSTEENIRLAMGSVKEFQNLSEELDLNTEFEQGGYLILNYTPKEDEEAKKNVNLQNKLGLESRYISPEEAAEIFPLLNTEGVISATYNPTDGHANPFWVTLGCALSARKNGVDIVTGAEVVDINFNDAEKRVRSVRIDDGREIKAQYVVNAAGAYSAALAKKAGVNLPNKPYRHEILATEVIDHCMDPMVISFSKGIYFNQTARGEIVGGIGDPNEKPGFNTKGSLTFLRRMSTELCRMVPRFSHLKVVRQWAGLYDVTPDARPILGPVPGRSNFLQMNGYSGHGFMISPMCAKLTAEVILHGKAKSMDISSLSVERFSKGEVKKESYVVG